MCENSSSGNGMFCSNTLRRCRRRSSDSDKGSVPNCVTGDRHPPEERKGRTASSAVGISPVGILVAWLFCSDKMSGIPR